LFCVFVAGAVRAAEVLQVDLNGAQPVLLSASARDVVIANPAIADVSLTSPTQLVVIGKSVGLTTLLVYGQDGSILLQRAVTVTSAMSGHVSVIAPRDGAIEETVYACGARCGRETLGGDAASSSAASSGASAPSQPASSDTGAQAAPAAATP